MATKDTKVTPGDVVSATRKYSNKDNADRKFNISADVNITNGKVTNINNGSMTKADEPSYGSANFSMGEGWMNFNINNLSEEDCKMAFEAMMDFSRDVKADVESNVAE